jgi:hypothetical protein
MAELPAPEQEVQSFLPVPSHLYPIGRIELAERPQGKLDLEGIILYQQNVGRQGGRRISGQLLRV